MKKKLIIVTVLYCLAMSMVYAGTTHEEAGRVNDALDGTDAVGSTVSIYYVPVPTDIIVDTVTNMNPTLGIDGWIENIGAPLLRQWLVGDDHIVIVEKTVNAGTLSQRSYYAVTNKNLTGIQPDEYNECTLREVPSPNAMFDVDHMDVTWNIAEEDLGNPVTTNIIGYQLYRSTNPLTGFALVTDNTIATTNFADYTVVTGNTYYYSLGLVFRAGITLNAMSAGSAPVIASSFQKPTVIISSVQPSLNFGYITSVVTVNGIVSDDIGIASWALKDDSGLTINSDITQNISGILIGSWDTGGVTEGVRVLTLTAANLAGLSSTTSVTVTIDRTFPTAAIVQALPSVNGIVSGSISVIGTITDNLAVQFWLLKANNITLNTGTASTINGSLTSNWNTVGLSDGPVTLQLTIVDMIGLTTTYSLRITIDNTAPVISGVTINNGDLATSTQRVTLNVLAFDSISPSSSLSMFISGNVLAVTGSTFTWVPYNSEIIVTLDGSTGINTVNVSIRDEVGNVVSGLDTINYTTSVNTQTIQIARDAVTSVGSKENIILSWDGGGLADIYALTNTFNETFVSADAVMLTTSVLSPWTDTGASGSTVNERYYRVVDTGQSADSHQATVGKYDYIVAQGSVKTISFPICPATTNAEIIFGTQLTPANNNTDADWITTGVGGTSKTYYRGFSGNWWLNNLASTLTLNCVSGYDVGVQPGNPTLDITIVGVVATTTQNIPLYNGLNVIARIYPTPIALNSANLGAGLTSASNSTDADKVVADDGNAWYANGGIWYTGNDPSTLILQPGKAYKIDVQGASTTWNQVLRQ